MYIILKGTRYEEKRNDYSWLEAEEQEQSL